MKEETRELLSLILLMIYSILIGIVFALGICC